ncbi:MAG: WxL protein peptidoglycan domain-containing protein, partial [Candidatus Dormibacteria bacterium]
MQQPLQLQHRRALVQRTLTVRCVSLLLALTALLGTATAVVASSGSAPPAPGLSALQPGPHGYFEYTLAPGSTVQGTAEVHNLTAAPADYLISVVDATTSEITGVAYGQPQQPQRGVAAWVRLPVGQVTVPAHGMTPVTFQLTVPQATSVGDYVAAVAVQTPAPTVVQSTTSGGPGVQLITTTRVLMAIVVHVPGPAVMAFTLGRPSLQLQDHVRQILVIPMHDAGNVLTKPYLSGEVAPCSGGKAVLVLDRQLDTFVPHTSISYPWSLNGQVLPAGCYQVHMSIGVGGQKLAGFAGTMVVGQATTRIRPLQPSVQLAALPLWVLIVVGASLIAVIIITLLLLRGRRERRLLLARLAGAQNQGR